MHLINVYDANEYSKCIVCVEAKFAKNLLNMSLPKALNCLNWYILTWQTLKIQWLKVAKKYYTTFV